MHYELDPALDYEKYLGYAKVRYYLDSTGYYAGLAASQGERMEGWTLTSPLCIWPLSVHKVDCTSPLRTDRHWLVRENHRWSPVPNLRVSLPGAEGKESRAADKTEAVRASSNLRSRYTTS